MGDWCVLIVFRLQMEWVADRVACGVEFASTSTDAGAVSDFLTTTVNALDGADFDFVERYAWFAYGVSTIFLYIVPPHSMYPPSPLLTISSASASPTTASTWTSSTPTALLTTSARSIYSSRLLGLLRNLNTFVTYERAYISIGCLVLFIVFGGKTEREKLRGSCCPKNISLTLPLIRRRSSLIHS